jgi:hypothetical protein
MKFKVFNNEKMLEGCKYKLIEAPQVAHEPHFGHAWSSARVHNSNLMAGH